MTSAQERSNGLKCLNSDLPNNWEAKLVPDEGRIYYLDHSHQASSWLPPREHWDPGNTSLPYGWETAIDKNNKPYFINHIDNYTTREDPRDDPDYVEPPKPRDVELLRDTHKGFGFVAGSEKPVVVRFVTEGGPSVGKLLPGDQLIKINGQDVKKAAREYVIDLVRSCKQSIKLTVCQPYTDNSARKSALLTAAKKDKLKKNPSRVRFAEEVIVNGSAVPSNSPDDSGVPFMPNVLKVFLENGQTKSFKYDSKTTVKDVLYSLQEKLNIKCVEHFDLVLHNMKSHMPGRMTLLQEHENVAEIASRPQARHFRCLFRVMYVPKDSYDLLKQDPIAFEYFYTQCVNDVLHERFVNELKPDTILRLAALHIQQHAMSNNMTGKINIKTVEKEFGFEKFLPSGVRDNMRVKDLRKVLAQSLKMNQNLTAPGQKQLTALQAKLHYMKIVSELKTFGSRVFMVTLLDKKTEAMVLVGPKAGVSLVTNVRFYTLSMLADFSEIQCIKVSKEKDNMNRVELSVKGDEPGTLNLGLLKEDANNFVSMVNGYYKIFVDPNKSLVEKNAGRQSDDPEIPPYECVHTVTPAPWSYPEDIVSMVIGEHAGNHDNERIIDLSRRPPEYEGNKELISKLKHDLGIKSEQVGEPAKAKDTSHDTSHDTPHVTQEHLPVVTPGDNKTVISHTKVHNRVPIKTVITIEPKRSISPSPGVTEAKPQGDKHDTDSITSTSSTSGSQTSDQEVETGTIVVQTKRRRRSPTPNARVRQQLPNRTKNGDYNANTTKTRNSSSKSDESYSEDVEYVNTTETSRNFIKLIENSENNSDTDSGVGGEGDKQNTVHDRTSSMEAESDTPTTQDTPPQDTPPQTANRQSEAGSHTLPLHTELHLDLSRVLDPAYTTATSEPGSTPSPLPGTTSFMGQYDPDQLPPEVIEATYDPRMFFNHEVYVDPDIIDLTMLQPFPPTEEELAEFSPAPKHKLPPSPRVGVAHNPIIGHGKDRGRHPSLTRDNTMSDEKADKRTLHKSMSVGYCPDFLDDDIDAFIDKLTVQPPPSELTKITEDIDQSEPHTFSDRLGQSWDGPMNDEEEGLEYGNMQMSNTVDFGVLASDDNYSSLVIPPPPDESYSIDEISIVPPIQSVKEKRKRFEKSTDSTEMYRKCFKSKDQSTSAAAKENQSVAMETDQSLESQTKGDNKSVKGEVNHNDSPACVSEKLNELLNSLSTFDEENEPTGKFRRTSSLRLGKCTSLEFLNPPAKTENSKMNGLVTGSVRLKPKKMRPSLSLDRPLPETSPKSYPPIPPKSASLEKLFRAQNPGTKSSSDDVTQVTNMQRANSCDVLPTGNKALSDEDEKSVSENFASLKAKLQSYRDSLLNRSLRRKKNKDTDGDRASLNGDEEQPKSSLSRSNSFTTLIRNSLRRSSKRDEEKKSKKTKSSESDGEETDENKSDKDKDLEGLSARDRKIWNTLTTPRANFRPNTGSNQTQDDIEIYLDSSPEMESLAPKPSIPASVDNISEKGETRKQKAGPLKALSHVFDTDKPAPESTPTSLKPKSSPTATEKSPKRMAPEIPKTPIPTLLKQTDSLEDVIATTISTRVPTSPSVTSKSVTGSVTLTSASSRSEEQNKTTSGLTKPLTIPMAPPRRKHSPNTASTKSGGDANLSPRESKSKDDSDIIKPQTTNANVKTSLYSTVGKMWRPMSMSSSQSPLRDIENDETYRNFNNFDALREMANDRKSPSTQRKTESKDIISESAKVISNGHIGGNKIMITSSTSSTVVTKSIKKGVLNKGSVSEKSFALLRDKQSHTNAVKQILETVYTSEDFVQATSDVDHLMSELKQTMESLKSSRIDRKPVQFNMCKDELQSQVRQFVTDAKLLVSNATQTKAKLAVNMDASMHSLAKIYLHGQATMFMMEAIHQAQHLGSEVIRVANAYKSTLNAAHAAVGKPLADPHMKYLMRQATNLATLLSNLLKSLKTLEQK